jgi:isopentenyl-diphosphate Delta-isomerase
VEKVILVDTEDREIGTMEKMEAHRKGILHRAFSIILFNSLGEILLQKRSSNKYHSGGLWTNTCCSHPLPNETIEEATVRKLKQEMGIDRQTNFVYKFFYRVQLAPDLIEHECDHVYTGVFDGEPVINSDEVDAWKFISIDQLRHDVELNPGQFTYWFRLILDSFEFPNLISTSAKAF